MRSCRDRWRHEALRFREMDCRDRLRSLAERRSTVVADPGEREHVMDQAVCLELAGLTASADRDGQPHGGPPG